VWPANRLIFPLKPTDPAEFGAPVLNRLYLSWL